MSILGDEEMLKEFNYNEEKLILLIMTAAAAKKKSRLIKWKSKHPPSIKQWWIELF